MALENFKQTETLKLEHERLSKEYGDRYTVERNRILESIADEFKSFLTSEGLTVNRQGNVLKAIYGNAQLALEIPQATDSFFGAISILDLTDSRSPREKWKLVLLRGKNAAVGSRISVNLLPNDETERLTQQIAELRNTLDNFTGLEYSIMYYREQDVYRNSGAKEGPVVNNITDALTGILK